MTEKNFIITLSFPFKDSSSLETKNFHCLVKAFDEKLAIQKFVLNYTHSELLYIIYHLLDISDLEPKTRQTLENLFRQAEYLYENDNPDYGKFYTKNSEVLTNLIYNFKEYNLFNIVNLDSIQKIT